ncbi:sensor kinase/phosphatase LuxQ [Seminavis robusta]|uniref:histidine kinase n=1 Tax=Seminavis robusta TaxID=568900 RepID=A0A9N8DUL3_9STRA|nr:sensor kinase/phosphatase LuxQ [Seminavis robusta]|eukprot:Sro302_g112190.1 sensor kinase/phosphatase LuxQ (987) ;mRNA; f:27597-30926
MMDEVKFQSTPTAAAANGGGLKGSSSTTDSPGVGSDDNRNSSSGSGQASSRHTSLSSSNNNTQSLSPEEQCHPSWPLSKIVTARLLFGLLLTAVGIVLAFEAYSFLTKSEAALAETQFASIAERALSSAQAIVLRKRKGAVTLASVYANVHPHARDWPNVAVDGIPEIMKHVIDTSDGRGTAFMPMLQPHQVADWELFAYNYYTSEQQRRPPLNLTLFNSSFGFGIWARDPTLNNTDKRYHDTTGESPWGSPYTFLAPVFQGQAPGMPKVRLWNYHADKSRGIMMDDIYECSQKLTTFADKSCSAINDAFFLIAIPQSNGPAAFLQEPIYPATTSTNLTGFVVSVILWSDTLEQVVADEVSGVDCILNTATQSFTYHIHQGVATYIGKGDLHDPDYSHFGETIVLTGQDLFTEASATYNLTLYPSADYFHVYSTDNPKVATIGAACIIVFTSIAFLLYDAIVRRVVRDKQAILDAKRQFMRFVSHEVRTPLNSVVMGLKLLQEEIVTLFGATHGQQQQSSSLVLDDNHGNSRNDTTKRTTTSTKEAQMGALTDLSHEIIGSAESAVAVLNDLLNYDRIERGDLPLEISIVSIWKVIEATFAEFKVPYQAKGVKFELDFSQLIDGGEDQSNFGDVEGGGVRPTAQPIKSCKHLPRSALERRVIGDSIRISQVIRNLVSNAMKFTPTGGNVTVMVSWVRPTQHDESKASLEEFSLNNCPDTVKLKQSGKLLVAVKDTGAGMKPDQVQNLFRPGVQFDVNELQAGKGSGLGLYIAKGICEHHCGTLTAASDGRGKGTTITMSLPLYHVPDEALPESLKRLQLGKVQNSTSLLSTEKLQQANSSLSASNRWNDSLRILIVDDAHMNRKILTKLLGNRGHECDQAENGVEAVKMVKKSLGSGESAETYDTILMDYEMPIKNGPDAVKDIRALGCDSFVIGVTGNILPEDQAHFKECGANWVFPKPLRIEDLESIWDEYGITGRRRSVEENA